MTSNGTNPAAQVSWGVYGWLNRIVSVLIVMALCAAIIVKYVPLIRQNQRMRADLERQESETRDLRHRVERLTAELRALRTDPRTVERRLRELGYARPEDVVVTFTSGPGSGR